MGLHVLGTGLLAQEFFAILEDMTLPVEAFVENRDRGKRGSTLCGRPIIWVDDLSAGSTCICALSTTKRKEFVEQVEHRSTLTTVVHPSSVLLPKTRLAPGVLISTGVLVASHTTLGRATFLNRGVRVGHHTSVGEFVTVQPGANIAGAVSIGDQTYIGMGALVLERLTVGRGVTIAAGAVVREDVPDYTLVAGSPALIKKRNVDIR